MSQELTLFTQNSLVIPDYINDAFAGEDNIQPRAGVPTLAYRGRKWSSVINGERQTFVRRNADGDEEPISLVKVIILGAAPSRGRTYYAGKFDPEKPGRPDCWSSDGKTPDQSLDKPQAFACDKCPMSIKGSKINELGKETVACSQHRLLAVVPAGNLDHPPMRLRLAITSDFDSQSPDLEKMGWFAFSGYRDWLRSRGIKHTAKVVTKIKFDPNVDYPKVIFSAERFVDAKDMPRVQELAHQEETLALTTDQWTPNGEDGTPTAQEPAPAQQNARTESPKVIEGEVVKEAFITPEMEKEARQPSKPRQSRRAATSPIVEDEGDGFGAPAPTAPKAAAPAATEIPEDVQNLLSAWG